jgi:enoyl-CoA hydratase/carnithine racemase
MKANDENILVTKKDGVGTIRLNRPETLNALSPKMLDDLVLIFDEMAGDRTVKTIILTGTGKAFSSGGDVKQGVSKLTSMAPFEFRSFVHTNVVKKMVEIEKPVIAAVNGIATGGGLDIALACDIRFASEKARFSAIFVKMGLISDLGGIYHLPRLIGLGRAKLLAFTGDIIDAQESYRIGLTDKVFPEDELIPAAEKLAGKLANGPTNAIAMIKVAMNKSMGMDFKSSLDYTTNLQYMLVNTEDHKEAFEAFLEKRKPVFKGK